jgi:hypothetical protein
MRLQLQHIFTGVAVGAWEVQSQHMVDGRATGIGNGQIRGFTWLEMAATQGVHQRAQAFAAETHNANRTSTGRCGNGNDGGVVL